MAIYYFEQSGDHNYYLQSETVPALESSWVAAREAERLRTLGLEVVADAESGFHRQGNQGLAPTLERLEAALNIVSGVPELASEAQSVSDAAYDLVVARSALLTSDTSAREARLQLAAMSSDVGESEAALSVLRQALEARDKPTSMRLLMNSQRFTPPA